MKQINNFISHKRVNVIQLLCVLTALIIVGMNSAAFAHVHKADEDLVEPHKDHENEKEHESDQGHVHIENKTKHQETGHKDDEGKKEGDHHEHEKNEENETHDNHKGHDDHEEAELKFSPTQLQEFSIQLAQAKAGVINKTLDLTGEVIVAPERLYHVVPRVSGVVRQVFKHLGDEVSTGDLLAILSSRDLADAKAEFVAADSLLKLANANLQRERDLYKRKITAKREYLAARQVQAEKSIKRKAAKQRLQSIGLSEKSITAVLQNIDKDLTLYELRAPGEGVIIEKHAAQGEVLETNIRSFTVADLSQVWVNLTVYQKDLPFIQQGQAVTITTRFGLNNQHNSAESTLSWLSPTLDEKTRSAKARVVIDNHNGQWRPGLFVSAKVAIANNQANIVIPLSALQTVEGQTMVFVQHEEGKFEPQTVQTGRRDHQQVEILQGLSTGQTYVSQNAFSLKAQMQKSSFGSGHNH